MRSLGRREAHGISTSFGRELIAQCAPLLHLGQAPVHLRDEIFKFKKRLVLAEGVCLGLHLDNLLQVVFGAAENSKHCALLLLIETILLYLIVAAQNLVDITASLKVVSVVQQILFQ